MTALPVVAVVLVTYNSAACIRLALDSIAALTYPSAHLHTVMVDNASRDTTVAIVHEEYPWVHIYAEAVNHGFAGGNNIAMRSVQADYYVLVNADVVLHPNWLTASITMLESDPTIGVSGSKVFFGNRTVLQHTGGIIQPNALTAHRGGGELDIGQYNHPCDVDYVMGAAMLLRGDTARTLNYLPEAYFMYFEETEYCVRVRQLGQRIVYIPDAIAYHDEQQSQSGAFTQRFLWLYHRSRYLFVLRNIRSRAERQAFCQAERQWRTQAVKGSRYHWLLLKSKLVHWRLILLNPWFLHA